MNTYITLMADKYKIPKSDLVEVWKNASAKVANKNPKLQEKDPKFTSLVMTEFDNTLKTIHLEEAKFIMSERDKVTREGQKWIDALASDNYVQADGAFKGFVNASYNKMISRDAEDFIKKFAEKIKNDK
jgi:hypothetical protein